MRLFAMKSIPKSKVKFVIISNFVGKKWQDFQNLVGKKWLNFGSMTKNFTDQIFYRPNILLTHFLPPRYSLYLHCYSYAHLKLRSMLQDSRALLSGRVKIFTAENCQDEFCISEITKITHRTIKFSILHTYGS